MKRIGIIVSLFLFSMAAFAIPADVEDISNSKYFPTLLKAIQAAQKSIYGCLYYISYFPDQKGKVLEILTALVEAKKRGVKVEVILDRGYESAEGDDMSKKNIRAYSFLKQAGIPVFYDDLKTITHAKYFIIDENTVIEGSFNLSETALSLNRENGVLIKSPEIAKQFMAEYSAVPKYTSEPVKDAVPIPKAFLHNKELFPKILKGRYSYAVDFAFYVLKKAYDQNSRIVKITFQEAEKDLFKGKVPEYKGDDDAVQIYMRIYLTRWKKLYPEFIVSYRRDPMTKDLYIELKFENKALEDSLYVSKIFWNDGWDGRLSNAARFALLYVLDRTESGRMGRYFEEEQWDAVHEFGFDHTILSHGLTELQRFNLIDKDINFEIGEHNPNGIILNDFYVYSDFQAALDKLKAETDPELFQIVLGLTDSVNEVSDLDVFKQFIALGKKYGLEPLNKVLNKCKTHTSGISPYREFPYVKQAIINVGEGK